MDPTSELLLGVDIGTQGVKAALVHPSGKIVGQAFEGHDSYYPKPDWVEQDMHKNWWLGAVAVIRRLIEREDINPAQIRGIGVSGLYPAMGPTDGQGKPIYGAILYSDNRAVVEVEEVNRKRNLILSSEELTPKLIWFLRHEPELAAQMKMFFDAPHYLIYKLTGAYVTDTITAGLYGAIYESPSASWRPEVCDMFGIPVGILPGVYPPATIVGAVHGEAAQVTGLKIGTPVIAGMPDLYASMVSAGVVHMDESIAYYGSGGVLPVMKDEALNAAFKPFPLAEKGGKIQEGYLYDYPVYCLAVGDGVRWFRDQFAPLEIAAEKSGVCGSAYAQLDRLAEKVPPGSDGLVFLPYLLGQRSPDFNPWASGVYFGLRTGHGRAHLFRAVLEAWGFAIRHGLETFYPQGHPLKRLVATGGGACSTLWRQIVSDITGMRQDYIKEADGPFGAAYLAGLGVGIFDDFRPLRDWVDVSAVTIPDPVAQEHYNHFYQIYLELHAVLKPAFDRHHEILLSDGELLNV